MTPTPDTEVHINSGRARDDAMAWSRGHTDGWNEALAEVLRLWLDEGETKAFGMVYGSVNRPNIAMDDWYAALARDAEPVGLDVERLARAMSKAGDPEGYSFPEESAQQYAADVAAEYARLRESAKPEGGAG